jgi:glycosyltransferase involved in cell wall biosynthesis
MISVLVYTKNEELNIADCLATVSWSDDIHVVDSESDDDTPAIARRAGARVVSRSYVDESEQKNWAMRTLPFKHKWVFHIDADERCTPQLAAAMCAAVASPGAYVAFRCARRDYFLARWIAHVQLQRYSLRLMRHDCARYERRINPACIIRGPVGHVDGYLDHHPFSKGISQWIDRHNRYSTLEAQELLLARAENALSDVRKSLGQRDFHVRRYHQKRLFYRLPHRPLLKFFYMYLLKRGFLDGGAGFHYALLQSCYEYMISLKQRELMQQPNDVPEYGLAVSRVASEQRPSA